MKEVYEFRIDYKYAHFLFRPAEGKNLGDTVKVIQIKKEDTRFFQIGALQQKLRRDKKEPFFYGWGIKRKYTRKELKSTFLLLLSTTTAFEPTGEECGTLYDNKVACKICEAGEQQASRLCLKYNSIPKKDITRTIGGEIVVSGKFIKKFRQYNLNGAKFKEVVFKELQRKRLVKWYQLLINSPKLEIADKTIAGIEPFDLSVSNDREVYKCPQGHTIGLNLLSELYVQNQKRITSHDIFQTKQMVGVKKGLLRPEPLYICSQEFRRMAETEKLTGFEFEVVHIV